MLDEMFAISVGFTKNNPSMEQMEDISEDLGTEISLFFFWGGCCFFVFLEKSWQSKD